MNRAMPWAVFVACTACAAAPVTESRPASTASPTATARPEVTPSEPPPAADASPPPPPTTATTTSSAPSGTATTPAPPPDPAQRVAASARARVRACYASALARNPEMSGALSVTTTPSRDGCRFATVNLERKGALDDALIACVRGALLALDVCAGGGASFSVPTTFVL